MLELISNLLRLVLGSSKPTLNQSPIVAESPKTMALSIEAYFTSVKTGKDLRKDYGADYTPQILQNATMLLQAVNALLADLGIISITLNSGWRPPSYNASIGGAKNSAHCTGEACDLADSTGQLKQKLIDKPEILIKHDLYMEDPSATRTWCHLQTRATRSGKRVFKP